METFKIEITLGNDAMRTGDDICDALDVWLHNARGSLAGAQTIRDANGNRVVSAWIETD